MNNFNFKWGTHKQILYDYLNAGNTITTRDAMIDLGIGDLQGVIRDLKKEGVYIETTDKKVPTRYSKKDGSTKYAHIKEYALSKVGCNVNTYNLKTDEEQIKSKNKLHFSKLILCILIHISTSSDVSGLVTYSKNWFGVNDFLLTIKI